MNIQERRLQSWDDIHSYARPNWIYRGQRAKEWELSTSLERCCIREQIAPGGRPELEAGLVRDFRRVYHQYAQHVPAPSAMLEWIALMQHHGAPTRLLDFTYSVYVAAYFAFETAEDDCAVWAVNAPWALKESVALLIRDGVTNAKCFLEPTSERHEQVAEEIWLRRPSCQFAVPATPFRLNERLRSQRGTFLAPGDVSTKFMDNLRALPRHDQPESLLKLILPQRLRNTALEKLHAMNISRTSLFPGLDGYAQSLGVFHPSFRPAPW